MDLSFAAISTSAFSECQEFKTSIECAQQYNFKWQTTCKDKIANYFIEESECDRAPHCAWNDIQKIFWYNSLLALIIQQKQTSSCQLKDAICIAGDAYPDGSYIYAKLISDQKLCNSGLYQNQHEIYTYLTSSCQSINISKCSTITEQFLCTSLNAWKDHVQGTHPLICALMQVLKQLGQRSFVCGGQLMHRSR